jgi:hypothetical protein
MASETTAAVVANLAAIAKAEALLMNNNMGDLSRLIDKRALPVGYSAIDFPIISQISAQTKADGAAFDNAAPTINKVTLTPSAKVGDLKMITDLASHNAEQLAADLGKQQGAAITAKVNADIFALFDGFSQSVGAANTKLTCAVIRAGITLLNKAGALGEKYLVLTPTLLDNLIEDYSTSTGGNLLLSDRARDAVLAGKTDAPILGVIPYLVNSGISETTTIKTGLFTRPAIGMATAWEFKPETERDAASVATKLVMSSCYAIGEVNDTFGVEVLCVGTA